MFFKEGGLGDIYLVPNVSNLSVWAVQYLYCLFQLLLSACFLLVGVVMCSKAEALKWRSCGVAANGHWLCPSYSSEAWIDFRCLTELAWSLLPVGCSLRRKSQVMLRHFLLCFHGLFVVMLLLWHVFLFHHTPQVLTSPSNFKCAVGEVGRTSLCFDFCFCWRACSN